MESPNFLNLSHIFKVPFYFLFQEDMGSAFQKMDRLLIREQFVRFPRQHKGGSSSMKFSPGSNHGRTCRPCLSEATTPAHVGLSTKHILHVGRAAVTVPCPTGRKDAHSERVGVCGDWGEAPCRRLLWLLMLCRPTV